MWIKIWNEIIVTIFNKLMIIIKKIIFSKDLLSARNFKLKILGNCKIYLKSLIKIVYLMDLQKLKIIIMIFKSKNKLPECFN